MSDHQFTARRLLTAGIAGEAPITSKEAGFLGQMAFDANNPTDKQVRWLNILADRYGKEGNDA